MPSRGFGIDRYKDRLRLRPNTADFIASVTIEDIQLFIKDIEWMEPLKRKRSLLVMVVGGSIHAQHQKFHHILRGGDYETVEDPCPESNG
jgi:hypothetical protein